MNEQEQEEDQPKPKKGRNQFMEGNLPDNIKEDIDKSSNYLILQARKFIKNNENNKPYKCTMAVVVQFEHIPTNKLFTLWARVRKMRKR